MRNTAVWSVANVSKDAKDGGGAGQRVDRAQVAGPTIQFSRVGGLESCSVSRSLSAATTDGTATPIAETESVWFQPFHPKYQWRCWPLRRCLTTVSRGSSREPQGRKPLVPPSSTTRGTFRGALAPQRGEPLLFWSARRLRSSRHRWCDRQAWWQRRQPRFPMSGL